MKKIIIFNYFIQKCTEKIQELYGISNPDAAKLCLITSDARMIRRHANGCTTEEVCFCKPMYAQELFLYLCKDAQENGDNLIGAFDFHKSKMYLNNFISYDCYEDGDITGYLEKMYPKVSTESEVRLDLFEQMFKTKDCEAILTKFIHPSNMCYITECEREVYPSETSEELQMVDRAWNRLEGDNKFTSMLEMKGKHDQFGKSHAYVEYIKKLNL